jgi:ubiquinone/menaquinone biosynthesis C-methylase UbiE
MAETCWDNAELAKYYGDMEAYRSKSSVLKEALNWIADNDVKLLEVGCASGGFYNSLRHLRSNLRYTGIDITPSFIEYAKSKYPEADFSVADIGSYVDDSFGVVLARQVVSFAADPYKLISDMFRVSREVVCFDVILRRSGNTINDIDKCHQKVLYTNEKSFYNILNFEEFVRFLGELSPSLMKLRSVRFDIRRAKSLFLSDAEKDDVFYNCTVTLVKGKAAMKCSIRWSSDIIYHLKNIALGLHGKV